MLGNWDQRLRQWPIAARLFALVAVIAVPLFVGVVVQIRGQVASAERVLSERMSGRVDILARLADQLASEADESLGLAGALVVPGLGDGGLAGERLRAIAAANAPHVVNVALFSTDGRLVATASGNTDVNIADRDHFQRALAGTDIAVSEPFVARTIGRWVVAFARSLRDPSGNPRVVAVALVDLAALAGSLKLEGLPEGSLATLVSPQGRIIARGDGTSSAPGGEFAGRGEARRILAEASGRGIFDPGDGIERVSNWQRLERAPWTLYVGVPLAAAQAAPMRAGYRDLAILLAITALAVLAAAWLGRRIAGPVGALRDAAGQVAAGSYGTRVPVTDRGELGQLERDFNAMVERIGEASAGQAASEARLRSLLNLSSDWYWEQDAGLRLTKIAGSETDKNWARFATQIGKGRWESPYGGITEEQRAAFDAMQARREPFRNFEFMRPDETGTLRWVSISGEPIFDASGAFLGYRGTGHDIDARKRAEQAYIVSEERLAAATHAARIGIFDYNVETHEAYFSPDWKAQIGYAEAEVENRFEEFERRLHPEDMAFVLGRMRAYFANPRGDYVCEFRFRHRDGGWRWIRAQSRMFADEAGRAVRFVGAHVDITESRSRELELAERRRAHETLLANLSGMAYRCLNDGRWTITLVSPGCRDLTGHPPEDFLGNRRLGIAELVRPGDPGPIWLKASAQSAPQLRCRSEFRIVTATGEEKWVWDQAEGVYDDEGRLVAVDGLFTNITPRVMAEQAVRASEERLRMALAAGRMVAWDWAPGERIVWGEGAELIRGPLPEGMAEYPDFREMVHPEDRAAYLEAGRRAIEEGVDYAAEFRLAWLDGTTHWIRAQGTVKRGPDGRGERIVGLSQDVTERVAAGQALRESEARYRALLETTTDAVIMVDASNTINYVNPAVAPLFGWSPGELVGRSLEAIQPERMRRRHGRAFARVVAGERPKLNGRTMESVGLHRSGREIPLEVAFSPLDLGGRRYFVGFLRDISLRKRAERELQEINASLERHVEERTAQLRAAIRELEAFSYTVAHDLRAPLRAIDGFSKVLEEDQGPSLGEQARRYLRRIRSNTTVMAQMIDELLELARIGRAELQRRSVDLDGLARAVAEEQLGAAPKATVEIRGLPTVDADPTLMRIVLANLIGNALKFSARRKHPRVAVTARRTETEDIVSVEDNGAGFDPRHAGQLFGVFQRLHAGDEFDGTGIGLATVARIVQRHGGRVWADSRPGEGATFHFALPRGSGPGSLRVEAAA